jgi:hypothetical protein
MDDVDAPRRLAGDSMIRLAAQTGHGSALQETAITIVAYSSAVMASRLILAPLFGFILIYLPVPPQ